MENPQTQQYEALLKEQQKQQQEQQRQTLLYQLLTHQAKERLMQIKTVKPEKAVAIQGQLIRASELGTLKKKVTEADLVALLLKESQAKSQEKITFKRHEIDDQW